MLDPPTRQSRSAGVAEALRADIISGIFAPGERLTEDRMSERYGVSRIPVREALRGLEAEGFVIIEPYRGAQVAQMSLNDAMDLLEVRQTLEAVATRRAAIRRPWDAVQHLAKILNDGNNAIIANDFMELARLNTELHMAMVKASGNYNLVILHDQIRAKAQWVYSLRLDERAADSWREHEDIVAAVAAGDEELAGTLAQHHVTQAAHHFKHHAISHDSQPAQTSHDKTTVK